MEERNMQEDVTFEEISMPPYVELKEKYKCDKCKYNKKNAEYRYKFPEALKYIFADCKANPHKRTECKKRCSLISTLFSILTAAILILAYLVIFSHTNSWLSALPWTIIFGVALDIVCYLIELGVDKIFENIEKMRRNNYDKKVENIEAINRQKRQEARKQKEKEELVYKDINEANSLFSELSKTYKTAKKRKKNSFPELNEELMSSFEEFIKSLESLLSHINLDNFYYSDIKIFFQIHLPKLKEYIMIYLTNVEDGKETEQQIKELIKLLERFNTKAIQLRENLINSNAESLVYKMQALGDVVSTTRYREGE